MLVENRTELIVQLFRLYARRNCPPDILSVEYPENKPVIQFQWFSGKTRVFGFTQKAFDAVWDEFNIYWAEWRKINGIKNMGKM